MKRKTLFFFIILSPNLVQAAQGHSAPSCVSLYEYHEGDTSSEAFPFRFNLQGSIFDTGGCTYW